MKNKLLYRIVVLLLCFTFVFSLIGCENKGALTSSDIVLGGDSFGDEEFDDELDAANPDGTSQSDSDGDSQSGSQSGTSSSGNGQQSNKPIVKDMKGRTFTFCAPSWEVVETDDAYVKQLQKTYNCKFVNLQLADYTTLYSSILSGSPIADVVILPESKFYVYAQKKLLKSLSDVGTLDVNDNSLFVTSHNKNFTVNGKVYGLSFDSYGLQRVLLYNRSLLKGNDDLQILADKGELTWNKLREILQKSVKNGSQGIAGMMQESDVLSTLIHANGGRVFTRDNLKFTYSFESNNTRNAISFAQSLYSGGMIMKNNGGNYLYPQTQFAKGKVAMMIGNSWNLDYVFERAKFDVGIVLFPAGPDASAPLVEQTEFSTYTIPSTAKNPDDIGIIFTAWAREAAKNEMDRGKQNFVKRWEDIIGDTKNMAVIKSFVNAVEKGDYYTDFENAITSFYDDGLYGLYNKVLYGEISAQSYLESVGNVYKSKAADFK